MKPARRTTLAVLGSLALHVSPLVRGGCGFDVDFDMPELEFELTELEPVVLDAQLDQKPPESPQPEPEVIPPPMGPEKPPEGEGPKPIFVDNLDDLMVDPRDVDFDLAQGLACFADELNP